MREKNKDGTYKRMRKVWSIDNFNDGYVNNRGRLIVWMPDHPQSYEGGYILRSRVAFEVYYGIKVPLDIDIHHLDGNRLNDSKENLAMIPHGKHSELTHQKKSKESNIERICKHCKKTFIIKKGRLKDPSRGQYCSQKCYHAHRRTEEHKKHISEGMKKAHKEGKFK